MTFCKTPTIFIYIWTLERNNIKQNSSVEATSFLETRCDLQVLPSGQSVVNGGVGVRCRFDSASVVDKVGESRRRRHTCTHSIHTCPQVILTCTDSPASSTGKPSLKVAPDNFRFRNTFIGPRIFGLLILLTVSNSGLLFSERSPISVRIAT